MTRHDPIEPQHLKQQLDQMKGEFPHLDHTFVLGIVAVIRTTLGAIVEERRLRSTVR